jgi:hypothetical protein
MTVDWSMAAVATSLAIFAAPMAWKGAVSTVSAVQKMTRNIVRLKWGDIPAGKVHDCNATQAFFMPCYHSHPHSAQKRCWESESGLATIYNRAWELSKRRPQFAKHVPDDLPSSNPYICTDARTMLAFVLVTAPERKDGGWNPAAFTYGSSKLACESRKGITFCHIQGSFQQLRADLTKHELERMLDGYPPWYRNTFVTRGRVKLPFPISSLSDVSRGGWIVAVGLMNDDIRSQAPLALYRCQDEPEEPDFRGNGVVYRKAIARCLDHISRNIQPHFPNDVNVKAAATMLEYLLQEKTASGIPCPGEFSARWNTSNPIPHLRGSDCRFLMKNFNDFRELDVQSGEKGKLEMILLPAMAAVVHGAIEVVEYLKDIGVEFEFPKELAEFGQGVYLRDCVSPLLI